jgi:type I restriction enzyme, S subunit
MSTIPVGYKQTEIGVIPEDWEVQTIGKICQLVNGRGFKPHEWQKNGLPIIRIQNLNGSDEYNYYQGNYDKKIEVETGQLLFAWSGSRGTSFGPHIWQGSLGLLNYHTWKIIVDANKIDPDYFLHALKKLTKIIEDQAHGASALVHTQKWEMEEFEFILPPTKTEQQLIATALSDTDLLIESLEKLIAKKRQIKQGAMKELLSPKEGWEVKKLGEIALIATGNTPPTSDRSNYGDEYLFVSPADLGSTKWIIDSEKKLSQKGFNISRKFPKNSILFTCIGSTIGKTGMANRELTSNQQINAVFPSETFSSSFLYYQLNYLSPKIKSLAGEQAVPLINKTQFSETNIPLPSTLIEQENIATILSDMDAEITALEERLEKTRTLKSGMMHELLTGRIRLV